MSIQTTLLSRSPKRNGVGSSGGGDTYSSFLHLAWADSEQGLNFTKNNTNDSGEILKFKYLGLCMNENREDDALVFDSYLWTDLCPCFDQSDSDSSDGSDGNDGSDGSDGSEDNPDNPPAPDSSIGIKEVRYGDCIKETDNLRITANNITKWISIGDEQQKVSYKNSTRKWEIPFYCNDVTIEVWYDFDLYDGPMYFANFSSDYISNDDNRKIPKLNVSCRAESIDLTPSENVEQGHTNPFEFSSSSKPVMSGDKSSKTYQALIKKDQTLQKNCLASFIDIFEAIYGETKTIKMAAVRGYEDRYEDRAGSYMFSLYDVTYNYRWKSSKFETLLEMLPKEFVINYSSITRRMPIVCSNIDPNACKHKTIDDTTDKEICRVNQSGTLVDFSETAIPEVRTISVQFLNDFSASDLIDYKNPEVEPESSEDYELNNYGWPMNMSCSDPHWTSAKFGASGRTYYYDVVCSIPEYSGRFELNFGYYTNIDVNSYTRRIKIIDNSSFDIEYSIRAKNPAHGYGYPDTISLVNDDDFTGSLVWNWNLDRYVYSFSGSDLQNINVDGYTITSTFSEDIQYSFIYNNTIVDDAYRSMFTMSGISCVDANMAEKSIILGLDISNDGTFDFVTYEIS